ncbi:MAG: FliM/FliN family flagellar motor switch protein [Planctomycetota bacterium]|jgi:flagellar motor switch protein FliM
MSSTPTENLSKKKLQQLLAAVGSRPTEDATQTDCTEYNWHQPNYFNTNQLRKLDSFTKKMAIRITQKFADLCHCDSNVTITSTNQHFAEEFFDQVSAGELNDHYLAFSIKQEQNSQTQHGTLGLTHPCGLIGIPPQSAISWVSQLLGDSDSKKDSNKDLSLLEESLLLDIASSIVEAFSESYTNSNFQLDKSITRGHLPLEVQGIEEICKITFSIENTSSKNTSEAYFLIPCRILELAINKDVKADSKFSAEDISKAILGHLQQMMVSITAQLASTVLSFEEIVNLQAGDILLLEKGIDETAELLVEGKTLFRGRPAKSAGRHAVVITEQCPDKE